MRLIAILVAAMPITGPTASQEAVTVSLKQFFLDHAPSEAELSTLPKNLKDRIDAKVRIDLKISTIERDQGGKPPPIPTDLFVARVVITDVLNGNAQIGDKLTVYFGVPFPRSREKYKTPPPREWKTKREYFVVSYVGDDKLRRLHGFPVSQEDFDRWEKEEMKYQIDRNRPGVIQE
jgi:hypothetical protein